MINEMGKLTWVKIDKWIGKTNMSHKLYKSLAIDLGPLR